METSSYDTIDPTEDGCMKPLKDLVICEGSELAPEIV